MRKLKNIFKIGLMLLATIYTFRLSKYIIKLYKQSKLTSADNKTDKYDNKTETNYIPIKVKKTPIQPKN